ncbi:MAG: hypothetical protein O2968_04520, partial [Acidobacteria bacterium]|nr:hypothetical protein [Acidobacteriota bacterium]
MRLWRFQVIVPDVARSSAFQAGSNYTQRCLVRIGHHPIHQELFFAEPPQRSLLRLCVHRKSR